MERNALFIEPSFTHPSEPQQTRASDKIKSHRSLSVPSKGVPTPWSLDGAPLEREGGGEGERERERERETVSRAVVRSFIHSFIRISQLRSSPTKYGENMSPSTEPHTEGRHAYNGVRPGSPVNG